jgi:hypothetical protein
VETQVCSRFCLGVSGGATAPSLGFALGPALTDR